MITLKLSESDLKLRFAVVSHSTFQSALAKHWQTVDNCATAQSVCWLFCWAATGMGSETARNQAEAIFDAAFCDFKFADFNTKVGHQWALDHRYVNGNIDTEIINLLKKK
jgi:hypothetical protein